MKRLLLLAAATASGQTIDFVVTNIHLNTQTPDSFNIEQQQDGTVIDYDGQFYFFDTNNNGKFDGEDTYRGKLNFNTPVLNDKLITLAPPYNWVGEPHMANLAIIGKEVSASSPEGAMLAP